MAKDKILPADERQRIFKEEMKEEAQQVVQDIIGLEAQAESNTLVQYYQQAVKLRSLAEEKEKYGPDAFKQAWQVLGHSERWAEQRVVVARRFDLPTINELAQKRDKDGNAFSWTHLDFLAMVDAKGIRKSLVNQWVKECYSCAAFGEVVRARIAQAEGTDHVDEDSDGSEGAGGEGGEGSAPVKTTLRIIKHAVAIVEKTDDSLDEIVKMNYKKLPVKDRKELIKLSKTLDSLTETINTIISKFPVEDVQQSIDDEQASADSVLGDSDKPSKPTKVAAKAATKAAPSKAAKTTKAAAPAPAATASDDDDDLFGDVGGDGPIPTDPADLVPVHSAKKPNRASTGAKKKKSAKKPALATTGPGKDKRRG